MTTTGYSPIFREPTGSSATFSGCRIYLSAQLSPTGNLSPIPFDASDLDTDGYADLANNRIVIPTGLGGWFKVTMRVGAKPQSAISTGYAVIFLRTAADGIREYDEKGWTELEELRAHQAQFRIVTSFNFVDGAAVFASWQDGASGGGGFYLSGGSGGGLAAPESYLEVLRLGDA